MRKTRRDTSPRWRRNSSVKAMWSPRCERRTSSSTSDVSRAEGSVTVTSLSTLVDGGEAAPPVRRRRTGRGRLAAKTPRGRASGEGAYAVEARGAEDSTARSDACRRARIHRARSAGCDAAASPGVTQRNAGKLFTKKKIRDGQRMLIIAAGLTVALVAADLLDLTRRGGERRRGISLR